MGVLDSASLMVSANDAEQAARSDANYAALRVRRTAWSLEVGK